MNAPGEGGRRRRVLLLLPTPPRLDANHGGGKVASGLIDALARRHDIAALYLRAANDPPIDERLAARCALVREVPIPAAPSLGMRLTRRLAPLRGIPAWAAHVSVPRFAREVRDVVTSWQPDVVQFEYHVMGQYVSSLGAAKAVRILNEYEAGVLAARDHLLRAHHAGSLRRRLEQRAWTRFERRVIGQMNAVVVFAERDRDALLPLAGATPIVRIGIGVTVPSAPLDPPSTVSPPELLFVGNFNHPPNVDAASRLTDRIFPRVRERVPGAVLRIVGPDPPPALRATAGDGVEVTGHVPDVTPYLAAATLVVVPLQLGGGMRVKVAEALAHGKAVVATPRAIEGLDVDAGVHVTVAGSDDEFAKRVVELLLGPPEQRHALGTNAYEWARARFGGDRWAAEYTALYDRLLASRDRSA